jgi:hypothetical protein
MSALKVLLRSIIIDLIWLQVYSIGIRRYRYDLLILVTQAIDRFGTDKVGVYLVAFDEVVPIFIEAQNQPVLSMVKWYGSGTSALNKLVRNIEAAMFAAKTDFINPIFGIDYNSYKFKLVAMNYLKRYWLNLQDWTTDFAYKKSNTPSTI